MIYYLATRHWAKRIREHWARKPKLTGTNDEDLRIYQYQISIWRENFPKFRRSMAAARRISF